LAILNASPLFKFGNSYVSKETREGVERAYQKIEIIEGAISESTPVESTGAEKNKLFPTSVAYLLNDFLGRGFLLGKYQQHLRLFGGRACKSF
jgi:hypothetical protein